MGQLAKDFKIPYTLIDINHVGSTDATAQFKTNRHLSDKINSAKITIYYFDP